MTITIDGNTKHMTGAVFRLAHDNIKALALIEGTEITVTSTNHEVEEFKAEQEALDYIIELGLEYNPSEEL